MVWGFGTESKCSDNQIQDATRQAFQLLRQDQIAGAAWQLVQLPGIGISRASKVLALKNQNDFGIYDSHSAHGLSDLVDASGNRVVLIPPGRNNLIPGDHATKKQFCAAFERFTWVLREFRRMAALDRELCPIFTTVAEIEIALFSRSRNRLISSHGAPPRRSARRKETVGNIEGVHLKTLGKGKPFQVVIEASATTVITGDNNTPFTLRENQIRECLNHFGEGWFPLSNSKTDSERDPDGLGEYFSQNFGSSVFASHLAALWKAQGKVEVRKEQGRLELRVIKRP